MTEVNKVTEEEIDALFERCEFEVFTVYDKVTVVVAKLPNGFTIVESSACVDPANYSEGVGTAICMHKIKNQLWQLEGYVLQNRLFDAGLI